MDRTTSNFCSKDRWCIISSDHTGPCCTGLLTGLTKTNRHVIQLYNLLLPRSPWCNCEKSQMQLNARQWELFVHHTLAVLLTNNWSWRSFTSNLSFWLNAVWRPAERLLSKPSFSRLQSALATSSLWSHSHASWVTRPFQQKSERLEACQTA